MGSSLQSFYFFLCQAKWDNNSDSQVQNAVWSDMTIASSHLTELKHRMDILKEHHCCALPCSVILHYLNHSEHMTVLLLCATKCCDSRTLARVFHLICSKLLEEIIKYSELMAQMSCSKLSLTALSSLTAPLSLTHFFLNSPRANQQIAKHKIVH